MITFCRICLIRGYVKPITVYLMYSTSQSGQSGIIDRLTLSECMSEIPGALMLRLARRLRDSFGSICTVCIIEVYCFMQI